MKEVLIPLNEIIKKGLAPNHNPRNKPMLVESVGAYPFEGQLQSVKDFSAQLWVDISALPGVTFPYPQVFFCSEVIIVCTANEIYEWTP